MSRFASLTTADALHRDAARMHVADVRDTSTGSDTHPGAHYKPLRFASRMEAIGVVIPARNHAATISQCILGIFAANSYSGWRNALWIVVVADACTDQTADGLLGPVENVSGVLMCGLSASFLFAVVNRLIESSESTKSLVA